ncbi:unnamed protein product, partial [Closterium sp. NIES-53]
VLNPQATQHPPFYCTPPHRLQAITRTAPCLPTRTSPPPFLPLSPPSSFFSFPPTSPFSPLPSYPPSPPVLPPLPSPPPGAWLQQGMAQTAAVACQCVRANTCSLSNPQISSASPIPSLSPPLFTHQLQVKQDITHTAGHHTHGRTSHTQQPLLVCLPACLLTASHCASSPLPSPTPEAWLQHDMERTAAFARLPRISPPPGFGSPRFSTLRCQRLLTALALQQVPCHLLLAPLCTFHCLLAPSRPSFHPHFQSPTLSALCFQPGLSFVRSCFCILSAVISPSLL